MTSPIRVLYVNHMDSPTGAVRSLRFLIESFPPGTVSAHVLSPPGRAADFLRAGGINVIPIKGVFLLQNMTGQPIQGVRWLILMRELWRLRHGSIIRRAIREIRPDLVHLNEHGMFQAAAVARSERIPVLMHVRCVADRRIRWQTEILKRTLPNLVDRVVAIDHSVARSLEGIASSRVVYNPMAPVSHGSGPREPGGPVRVGFLAGIQTFKGIWDLLEAARILRGRTDIRFDLFGGNRWPDAFYRSLYGRALGLLGVARNEVAEIRTFIERERLRDSVRLLGHVETDGRLFAQMDVLAFPSHMNGPGRSVFEAGLHGIPSVVALKDVVQDVVRDGVTGLIVLERNPRALAEAIRRLADDAGLRHRMGQAAMELYRDQFNPRRVATEMLTVYRDLLTTSTITRS